MELELHKQMRGISLLGRGNTFKLQFVSVFRTQDVLSPAIYCWNALILCNKLFIGKLSASVLVDS